MSDKTARLRQQAMDAHERGALDEADRVYHTLLKQNPRDAGLLHMAGLLAAQRGDVGKAQDLLGRALIVKPDLAASHCTLGDIKAQLGDIAGAESHYRQALKFGRLAEAQSGLALLLLRTGRGAEAVPLFRSQVGAAPRNVEAHLRLGQSLRAAGDASGWLASARNAMSVMPAEPLLARDLGEAEFAAGNERAGWTAFAHAALLGPANLGAGLPAWQGQDIAGGGLFIWMHGTPSEEIACARLLPCLTAASINAVVRCSPRIGALLRRSFPTLTFIDRAPTPAELAGLTAQTPAAALGVHLAAGPERRSYLVADEARRTELRGRYATATSPQLRVGIAWQSFGALDGRERSVNLGEWGPVLNVPGAVYVSLQHGPVAPAIQAVAQAMNIAITQDAAINPLGDLDLYAAQIAALDFVVTSSNTVAHLAGALGVPAVCLAPPAGAPGDRASLSAYPSVQIVRKTAEGAWLPALFEAALGIVDAAHAAGALTTPADYLRALGETAASKQAWATAEKVYRRLAQLPSLRSEALTAIAGLSKRQGDAQREHSHYIPARQFYEHAIAIYDEAIAAQPDNWHALNARAVLIANLGRPAEAVDAYAAVLAIVPEKGEVLNNLGLALRACGRSAEALETFERALATVEDKDTVTLNSAGVLDDLGRTDEAVTRMDDVLARRSDHVDIHYNKAITLLAAGRLREGWSEFDWRLKHPSAKVRHDMFPVKRWAGDDLRGKRVLVWTEQGLGDELMAASILPDLMAVARAVTIRCSPRMVPLLKRSFPAADVGTFAEPLPRRIDLQMSVAELGVRFRPTMESFPARVGFLLPDVARRDALRATYQAGRPGTKLVGLSWGSGNPEIGALKSLRLADLAPMLTVPDVTFVNLQYGDHTADLADIRTRLGVNILTDASVDPLQDMDAFAAQTAAMDLVVSVSNTTVHTAGALGIPTLVLLPEGRGRIWYWFRGQARSAWYPSVEFLRQSSAADWRPVITTAAERLAEWATGRPG